MAEDGVSQQILEAVQTALVAYLPGKVPTCNPKRVSWSTSDVFVSPPDCPAISIVDRGWTKVDETCRATNLVGAEVGGMLWRKLAVEVQPWLKAGGANDEALRKSLREWCDGIAAVVDAYYQLGSTKLIGKARAGSNFETIPQGRNLWMGAGQVTLSVDVFIRQGETAL